MILLTLLAFVIVGVICDEVQPKVLVSTRDSYLDAYKESHQKAVASQASKKEYVVPHDNGIHGGYPDALYNHPPTDSYGAPKPIYGAPAYGPPAYPPGPNYGPPIHHYEPEPPIYGMPHAMLGILDKFKLKLDLFTLGKILLKLVIFKKIVSFIGILCLLLFIPSLKNHDKDESMEEDMRAQFKTSAADERINNITSFVLEAIDYYSSKQNENQRKICDSTFCKGLKFVKHINNKLSYSRLMKMYRKELKSKNA